MPPILSCLTSPLPDYVIAQLTSRENSVCRRFIAIMYTKTEALSRQCLILIRHRLSGSLGRNMPSAYSSLAVSAKSLEPRRPLAASANGVGQDARVIGSFRVSHHFTNR